MTYTPPEKTNYEGIPLGGDDLTSGGPVLADNLPEVDESEIGVLQDVDNKPTDIPLAGDLLGNDAIFREEPVEQGEEKTEGAAQQEAKEEAQETFRLGDQTIAPDTKFNIDGAEYSAKEILNVWKTRDRITQDFGKLSQLQQLQGTIQEKEASIRRQTETLKKGLSLLDGTLEGQRKFFISCGIDPYEYEDKIKTAVKEQIEKEAEMTAEEIYAEKLAREREIGQTKAQTLEEQLNKHKEDQEFVEYQQQIARENNVTLPEMQQVYGTIQQRIDAVKSGTYTPGPSEMAELTKLTKMDRKQLLSAVANITKEAKLQSYAIQVIDKIDPTIKNRDNYSEILQAAFAELANPYRVSEPSEEGLIKVLKARFDLETAKPNSDMADGSKEESEKSDGVRLVQEVPYENGSGIFEKEEPLDMDSLLSW